MTLQKIEFEYDIPDGYRFVRYGKPKIGDFFVDYVYGIHKSITDFYIDCIVIEKITEQTKNKRLKHADLIHAWAEGDKIQYFDNISNEWIDTENNNPSFYHNVEYRIKPKTKTVRFRNYATKAGNVYTTYYDCHKDESFLKWLGDWQNAEIEEND